MMLVEFFRAHLGISGDRGKVLRVSRYLDPKDEERHVRFSVWNEARDRAEAESAVSLDEAEALRLARFLQDSAPAPPRRRAVRAFREQFEIYTRSGR